MTFVSAFGWPTLGSTCEVHLKYNIELYNNEHKFNLKPNYLSKYYFEDNPFIQHLLIEYFM